MEMIEKELVNLMLDEPNYPTRRTERKYYQASGTFGTILQDLIHIIGVAEKRKVRDWRGTYLKIKWQNIAQIF